MYSDLSISAWRLAICSRHGRPDTSLSVCTEQSCCQMKMHFQELKLRSKVNCAKVKHITVGCYLLMFHLAKHSSTSNFSWSHNSLSSVLCTVGFGKLVGSETQWQFLNFWTISLKSVVKVFQMCSCVIFKQFVWHCIFVSLYMSWSPNLQRNHMELCTACSLNRSLKIFPFPSL